MLSFGRRRFVSLISATSVAALAAVDAYAQAGRVYRVGILETVSADRNRDNLDALLRGLRERGYVEGQNLRIEYRSADGRADRFLDLATGTLRPLPGVFPRCTVGGIVALSWIDDDRIAVSDCTVDLGGTPRTRVLSVSTGATLETRLGDQLVATLAGGVELRVHVVPAAAMQSPQVEQWLADRNGRVIARLIAGAHYLPAPDGSALAYADPDRLRSSIIDPGSGRQREIVGQAMTWTKQGELVIVRRMP